jgi:hypothetical protein
MTTESKSDAFQEIISRIRGLHDTVLDRNRNGNRESVPEKIPLIDPTANVTVMVTMVERRLDDLRIADNRRLDDLRNMKEKCDKAQDDLHEKLRLAESKRIDAVNLAERSRVDANVSTGKADVALASEKAAATAITLAASVVASAKALSDTVSSTTAIQDKRLTALEQNSWNSGGATAAKQADAQQRTSVNLNFITLIGVAFSSLLSTAALIVAILMLKH